MATIQGDMESCRPQVMVVDEDAHHTTFLFSIAMLLIVSVMRDALGSKAVYWFLAWFIVIYHNAGDGLGKRRGDRFLGSLMLASIFMGMVMLG